MFVAFSRLFIAAYWERAGHFALVYDGWLCFSHFPMWYPESGVLCDQVTDAGRVRKNTAIHCQFRPVYTVNWVKRQRYALIVQNN